MATSWVHSDLMIIVSKSMHGTPRKRLREVNYGKASGICQRCDFIRNVAVQTVVLTTVPELAPFASSVTKWPVTSSNAPLVSAICPWSAMTAEVLASGVG